MLRCSRFAPALAAAALIGAFCLAPSASAAQVPGAGQTQAAAATISAGSAPTLTALAFPAPATGWLLGQAATGGRAAIWRTGTAGATWQVQWEGAGSPLSISATDPAHAWALIACAGLKGSKPSCGRELLATSDGGRHWRVAATLPQAVNQVQFVSARLGVVTSDSCLVDVGLSRCPGQILVSRDGGAHWTRVLGGAAPVFATASATGQLWAAQTSASGITFLTSKDGGRSWHRLGRVTNLEPLTPAVKVSLAATASGGLTWASVFDQLSCAMHGCGVADLLHSATGGQTWSPVNLADSYPDECASNGIVFSAAPDGWAWAATGRNGAACAPPFGLMYRYGPSGWQQLPPWQLAQVSSLAAVSKDVAYAVSDRGVLSATRDGGADWTELLPAPAPAGPLDAGDLDRSQATELVPALALADDGAQNGGQGGTPKSVRVYSLETGNPVPLRFASPQGNAEVDRVLSAGSSWDATLRVVGSHLYVFGPDGTAAYNLDQVAEAWSLMDGEIGNPPAT